MNWSDLESAWKWQECPDGEETDPQAVRRMYEVRRARIARLFIWRDCKGAVIGGACAIYLAAKLWQRVKPFWPVGVAVALLLGVAVFFVVERLRALRARLGPDAPLLAKINAEIDELRHQRRLLHNVVFWFLAPMMTAVAIILATIFSYRPELIHDWSQKLFWLGFIVVCVIVCRITWAINRSCAKRTIEPRIAELERLREHLLPRN